MRKKRATKNLKRQERRTRQMHYPEHVHDWDAKACPISVRIPEAETLRPNYPELVKKYGLATKVRTVIEEWARTFEPSVLPSDMVYFRKQKWRWPEQVVELPRKWGFLLHPTLEENSEERLDWKDLEALTQSDLLSSGFLTQREMEKGGEAKGELPLELGWTKHGICKQLSVKYIGERIHVRADASLDNPEEHLTCDSVLLGKTTLLDDFKETAKMMWHLRRKREVGIYCANKFPGSRAQQLALLLAFTLYCLIRKTKTRKLLFREPELSES